MATHPSTTLRASGFRAEIIPDRWVPGSYTLIVDGTPQSHVNLDDPSELFFEYVVRMGNVIDQLKLPGEPLTAVHLGGGALTLPRYVEATRPGSRQQVIELESDLVDFVRTHLPWDRRASIRMRHGDARTGIEKLPEGLRGTVDLLVVDIFSGSRIPAHVTSLEFYRSAAAVLAPGGVMLVNVADGYELRFARGQAATVAAALPDTAVIAETQVLKGKRYGNLVLVASPSPLPVELVPHLLAAGPHPAKLVEGRELANWIAGAAVVTDADATGSPPPTRGIFSTKL